LASSFVYAATVFVEETLQSKDSKHLPRRCLLDIPSLPFQLLIGFLPYLLLLSFFLPLFLLLSRFDLFSASFKKGLQLMTTLLLK
jgi:hypothetical protein